VAFLQKSPLKENPYWKGVFFFPFRSLLISLSHLIDREATKTSSQNGGSWALWVCPLSPFPPTFLSAVLAPSATPDPPPSHVTTSSSRSDFLWDTHPVTHHLALASARFFFLLNTSPFPFNPSYGPLFFVLQLPRSARLPLLQSFKGEVSLPFLFSPRNSLLRFGVRLDPYTQGFFFVWKDLFPFCDSPFVFVPIPSPSYLRDLCKGMTPPAP